MKTWGTFLVVLALAACTAAPVKSTPSTTATYRPLYPTDTPHPTAVQLVAPTEIVITVSPLPSDTARPTRTRAPTEPKPTATPVPATRTPKPSVAPTRPPPSPTLAPVFTATSAPVATDTQAPAPTSPPVVAGYVCDGGQACIKGNISSDGRKLYHYPGCPSYNATKIDESKGERWFVSEAEAQAAGWVKAGNC